MERDDSDMLDDAIQYPQELSIDVHQKHLDHSLSSSPMSLSQEFTPASGNVYRSMDEDSTSHLDNLGDFEMLPGPADLWQTAVPVNTTGTIPVVTASSPIPSNPHDRAIAQIESVFEGIADALLAERSELAITLTAHRQLDSRDSIENPQQTDRTRFTTVKFPGKSAEEAWRFTVIVRVLELMHEAICLQNVITKRDLYYRDPALFGKQAVVDRYVDQITLAFGVPRSCMHVIAAAKGLIAGSATFCHRDGSRLDLRSSKEGVLIPDLEGILSVDMGTAQWLLVIEKEATFQSIITSDEWQSLRWQGIIATGKGYPDIATRAMVRFLTRASPQNGFVEPKIYGLMDYDPDGLAILSTYKHGSIKLNKEKESLVVPELCWLGLTSSHISDEDQTHRSQGLMPLTKRDRNKARKMLEQNFMAEESEEAEIRSQLQAMLVLNLKAELQILDAVPGALISLINAAVR